MADDASRTGKTYTTAAIVDFVNRTHVVHDAGLARAFSVPEGIPAIQVGPSDGKLLYLLLRLIDARRVVELGTLVGYSAIVMGRALAADGRLWTIEAEPTHAKIARDNIAAAGLADRVTVVEGNGASALVGLVEHGPFDAVFIDADKEGYDLYAEWAITNLRPGGLVLGDNAYLFGNLMDDTVAGRAMRAFHERVARSCDSVCVPTPDGLVVGIKR
jgi:caffeoyl-CoA O-methyltransferase